MAINITQKEVPTSMGNPMAGSAVKGSDFPSLAPNDKTFSTLRAAFALKGHALHSSNPADGPVTFWIERWGLVRYLPTIDAVRRFLEQIGTRL